MVAREVFRRTFKFTLLFGTASVGLQLVARYFYSMRVSVVATVLGVLTGAF